MLDCIKFFLNQVINFSKMLFTIDIGNNMSLGLILCILFIFLPVCYRVITFIKHDVVGELDELYDESRPRNIISETLTERSNLGNGKHLTYSNSVRYNRRFRR